MPTKNPFLLAFLATLLGPIVAPKVHLFYFVPYLVLAFYKHEKIGVLIRAAFCGVCLDLLSSGPVFGLTSLNYSLVCFLLYGQKRNFFEEKLSTLPLMSFLFSFLSTLVQLLFASFTGSLFSLSWRWVATDLIVMSLADALYALFIFSLPFQLIHKFRKLKKARRA